MVTFRSGRFLVVAAVTLFAAACEGSTAPTPEPVATAAVGVEDNRFTPPANTVQPGDTVTWTWSGTNPHNVTFDNAAITDSPTQTTGDFSTAFERAGDYTYYAPSTVAACRAGWSSSVAP